ncbi:MAG TPA: thioesterase family protein [Thermodesulfobacteriota bacterium]|jgi:predicted thioesterase|nr:thioesterase family protein [Thermodesulfobacteriota bacterium]
MVPGLIGKSEMIVKDEDLVSRLGDVPVEVLSTPRLIQLLETAAIEAIQDFIPSDQVSLGTELRIKHLSATPLGMKVTANALLRGIEKNRLLFLVDAYDEREKVAEGEHERVLVSRERFLQKVKEKRAG